MSRQTSDIIVVGSGASGLMAAIQAARSKKKVLILDHHPTPAKKLLATGNGKCNFTNKMQGSSFYRSGNPAFVLHALEQFSAKDVIDFFEEIGVCTRERDGYCYPRSAQASAVRNALLAEARRLDICILGEIGIREIRKTENAFRFRTKCGDYYAKKCILAAGGKAYPQTGSDGSGWIYAKKLGHTIVTPLPALVPLIGDAPWFSMTAGVRCDAKITLYIDEKESASDVGEVQMTDYGISGIPVFQVSRFASVALHNGQSVKAALDLIPEMGKKDIADRLCRAALRYRTENNWTDILSGLINCKLAAMVCEQLYLQKQAVFSRAAVNTSKKFPIGLSRESVREQAGQIAGFLKKITFPVVGTLGFSRAQVTCGGVSAEEINEDTMESKLVPGLYFAGEMIDVDGICGGYNLQWAWSSGCAAGRAAARDLKPMKQTYRIEQISMPLSHTKEQLFEKVCRIAGIDREDINRIQLTRQSVDARNKADIRYRCTVDFTIRQGVKIKNRKQISVLSPAVYHIPKPAKRPPSLPIAVIGAGPCGLFCAYLLALCGLRPVILERGKTVSARKKDVELFWRTGILNPESNVQFGEGGAGTFSDGKLNTLVKDKYGRNRFVLETFVRFGAPEAILYESKPHIGTDILSDVIRNMRGEILRLGGQFFFESQVTDFLLCEGRLTALQINHKDRLEVSAAVLAPGHSARDTFECLYSRKIPMESKSFAVGLRVEHPQHQINDCQYGLHADQSLLPAASYKLTHRAQNGRGVYTFCMCPGGYVVNASSGTGYLAVNGMSCHGRNADNANSAVIVTVTPKDYPDREHPLSGVDFQRQLERAAWKLADGNVPQQLLGDFEANRESMSYGAFKSCLKGQASFANLRCLFPEEISMAFLEGMHAFGKKIRGFDRADCILSGVESRTSSPLRILRDECCESSVRGLFPCGEGAGYAGGIMSAAMDGMKTAEVLIARYSG